MITLIENKKLSVDTTESLMNEAYIKKVKDMLKEQIDSLPIENFNNMIQPKAGDSPIFKVILENRELNRVLELKSRKFDQREDWENITK